MAYFGVTATEDGLAAAAPGVDLVRGLLRSLEGVTADAPIVVLIHGYKFDPALPEADPHRLLYAFRPNSADGRRIRSWPQGLGFARDGGRGGLAVGFGWPARLPLLGSLLTAGRTGFAIAYDRAGAFGAQLAALVTLLRRLAPGRDIDLLGHSLGARVALASLPHLTEAPGRMLLLGAAEFGGRARDFLAASPAGRPPEVYNVTARSNDIYDALFEAFAPRRARGDHAVGLGLGAEVPNWLDLQLDRIAVTDWIRARGMAATRTEARHCHWAFYTADGALELYQAILRRRPGWDIGSLRTTPCFAGQEPRWTRLRHPRPARPAAGPEQIAWER